MNMMRMTVLLAVLLAVRPVLAEEVEFPTPSDDRWHYPFNFTPGARAFASCFSSVGNIVFPLFNDRDGNFLIAWDTSVQIEPGLCAASYDVRSVTVVLTNQSGARWAVDLTLDDWTTFDWNNDGSFIDPDPGRPLELFGVGFGERTSYETWTERTPYYGGRDTANDPQDPFPFVFQEETPALLHVEDSVKGTQNEELDNPVFRFTPVPWAIGVPIDYTPGDQGVPFDVTFDVDLTLSGGRVRRYFQEQLHGGRVLVKVNSLTETVAFGGGPGELPSFFTKEGEAFDPAGSAPRLIVDVTIVQPPPAGDVDGDCQRDLLDHAAFTRCISGPDSPPSPPPPLTTKACLDAFDIDLDGDVDLTDAGWFASRFDGFP